MFGFILVMFWFLFGSVSVIEMAVWLETIGLCLVTFWFYFG